MANIRISFLGENPGLLFQRNSEKHAARIRRSMRLAAKDVVEEFLEKGREDIKSSGNFGSRWTDALQGRVTEGGGTIRISFDMAIPIWTVFQNGKVIHGKPLLAIPLSFAQDAQGVNARDYPGRLFRVNRKDGKAPLLAIGKPQFEPKYFLKESVTIPKKFHLTEIARQVARRIGEIYSQHFRADNG